MPPRRDLTTWNWKTHGGWLKPTRVDEETTRKEAEAAVREGRCCTGVFWFCDCLRPGCGKKDVSVRASALTSGNTRSCGCLHRDISRRVAKKMNSSKKAEVKRAFKETERIERGDKWYLATRRAARELGVSTDTLRNWAGLREDGTVKRGCPWLNYEIIKPKELPRAFGRETLYFLEDDIGRICTAMSQPLIPDYPGLTYIDRATAQLRMSRKTLLRRMETWPRPFTLQKKPTRLEDGRPHLGFYIPTEFVEAVHTAMTPPAGSVTVREAAALLDMPVHEVYRYGRKGRLDIRPAEPGSLCGRTIPRGDVERVRRERRGEGATADGATVAGSPDDRITLQEAARLLARSKAVLYKRDLPRRLDKRPGLIIVRRRPAGGRAARQVVRKGVTVSRAAVGRLLQERVGEAEPTGVIEQATAPAAELPRPAPPAAQSGPRAEPDHPRYPGHVRRPYTTGMRPDPEAEEVQEFSYVEYVVKNRSRSAVLRDCVKKFGLTRSPATPKDVANNAKRWAEKFSPPLPLERSGGEGAELQKLRVLPPPNRL